MALPLVARELARIGRRRSAYALRMLIPCTSLALLLILEIAFSAGAFLFGAGGPNDFDAESLGRVLTTAAFLFQIGVVVLIAPVLSAGLVAQEKQDRTLGLLILADLHGFDIIFSKWLSAFLHAELLLLTTLPILAIAALFGGIAVPVMTLQVLLMTVAAATVCAAGIFASTALRRAGEAVVLTLAFIVLYTLVGYNSPALTPGLDWDIFSAAYNAENMHFRGPSAWLPPLTIAIIVATILLTTAAVILPSRVFEGPARPRRAHRRRHAGSAGVPPAIEARVSGPRSSKRPAHEVTVSPVAALVQHTSTGLATTLQPRIVKLAVSLLLALVSMMICAFGTLIVVALIAYDIASSMRSIRDQGLIDDLRLTPLEGRDLAKGIYHAHVRRCRFYYPALALSSGYGMVMMGFMYLPTLDDVYFFESPLVAQVAATLLVVLFVVTYISLLLRMVVLAACYFSRTTMTVAVQTILVVVVYGATRVVVTVASVTMSSAGLIGMNMSTYSYWLSITQTALTAAINLAAMLLAAVFFRQIFRETFYDPRRYET